MTTRPKEEADRAEADKPGCRECGDLRSHMVKCSFNRPNSKPWTPDRAYGACSPVLDSERGSVAVETQEWEVGYFFSLGKTSCGGSENVDATSAEDAVLQARARHPNATLRIRTVRDSQGEKHRVAAHDDPRNDND